jgi:hypothetical protein
MCLESLIKESWGQIQVTQQIFVKSQAPVAHFCNPNYLEGRDQGNGSSKLAPQIVHKTPISKIPNTKT